jgi:hypothetical protein
MGLHGLLQGQLYLLPHYVIFSSYLLLSFGSNSTLFSNALIPCLSLNVKQQISQPFKTATKNHSFACYNLYIFRQSVVRQNILN